MHLIYSVREKNIKQTNGNQIKIDANEILTLSCFSMFVFCCHDHEAITYFNLLFLILKMFAYYNFC